MEQTPYPNNTVTEPDLILRHVDYILTRSAMLNPAVASLVAEAEPEPVRSLWLQVVEVVRAIQEHPDPTFPVNMVHQPSKVREIMDGIVRRAAILEPEATRIELDSQFTSKSRMNLKGLPKLVEANIILD